MTGKLVDADVRDRVLDPTRSFLVQAPAGAGKTELLIRRYLRLLSQANEPEEILAITFTRKAAGEMRRRVLGALAASADDDATASLAAAVRSRDQARAWGLLEQPARLRISTIDGLNASLARAAPLRGGTGSLRQISETPAELYAEAARQVLELLGDEAAPGPALAILLQHLDNQVPRVRKLLAAQLGPRDQWLPVLGSGQGTGSDLRRRLEDSLARVVARRLAASAGRWPRTLLAEAEAVARDGARVLGWQADPSADALGQDLAWWRFLGDILLLKDKAVWRTSVTKNQGFPPAPAATKARAEALLADLAAHPDLAVELHGLRRLPEPRYAESQWRALEALVQVLPVAAAQLRVVFGERACTDYPGIAEDALAALGTEAEPGDSALGMDARVRHLLMDEFQDTSQAQMSLLRSLIRGWTPGDGRTVFLVGDPMQSVYRFRQAEVRLFLEVRESGLPPVSDLHFERLTTNFRSVPAIVDWVNRIFHQVFPGADDPLAGAVAYTACEAAKGPAPDSGVHYDDFTGQDDAVEGERVAELTAAALNRWPDQSIGILVRNRAHGAPAIQALLARGLPFLAVEQVHLGDTGLAADLLALTRALCHAGDRLAWLAVLRAPWCGLTLKDLAALAEADHRRTLWELMGDPTVLERLTPDGRLRLARCRAALTRAWRRRGQVDLRDLVEGLWLELGGPACAGADLVHADQLFQIIARHDQGGDCPDVLALADDLAGKPASIGAEAARVQVLTIHKAKGLQFDTVIVPRLGAASRSDEKPALLWEEIPGPGGAHDLLMAPVKAAEADRDRLYELLWELRRDQGRAESDRLLYVAATRAIRRLHLLGACELSAAGPRPRAGSLLERLWPAIAAEWPVASDALEVAGQKFSPPAWQQPVLERLPVDWQRPPPPAPVPWHDQAAGPTRDLPEFEWASHWARQAGSLVHQWLQHLAGAGVENYPRDRIQRLLPRFTGALAGLGVEPENLERAALRVRDALLTTLADPTGRWLLSGEHGDARTEWDLTVAGPSGCQRVQVDRSFVDQDGVRWIVDYKTSSHEGGDEAAFLAREADRYRSQLDRYRDAVGLLEDRPVRTALYFPLLGKLVPVVPD